MTTERERFEAWAVSILGDNPTWRGSGDCELAWQAWQAVLSAPAGYVLVPVEPTPEMLAACVRCWTARDLYVEMIAAAPKEPT